MLTAGNIARVRGLPGVRVGDRLGEPDDRAGTAQFPPPSLETIVTARPGQAARLHAALLSLADEDPLIRARAAGGGATWCCSTARSRRSSRPGWNGTSG